jgi:hypothetical protein
MNPPIRSNVSLFVPHLMGGNFHWEVIDEKVSRCDHGKR